MIDHLIRTGLGRAFLACALALTIAGCTHSVKIIRPLDGTYESPVTTLTVEFHPDFQPGTFHATLSGRGITHLFHPAASPGNTSTATVVFPPDFMDAQFDGNRQRLIVDGDFTTPTSGLGNRVTRDSSTFSPPIVSIFRGPATFDAVLTLMERETIAVTAYVHDAPKEALSVTITGSPLVSLNDMPAGQNIVVVIMPNERRADFSVRGIEVGSEIFRLRAIATGYASAEARGLVKARQ